LGETAPEPEIPSTAAGGLTVLILATEAAHHNIAPVMGAFFAFWVVVLIVLYVGTGMLLSKRERLLQKNKHGH
jgi:uncharacterized membrane protein